MITLQHNHLRSSNRSLSGRSCSACVRRQVQVCAGVATKKKKPGFRFDGANLRWVRDDRVENANVTVTPKTGSEYTVWPAVHTQLVEAGLRSISCQEAFDLQKKGWTLVDVRLAGDFEKQHASGAVNVPLYRYVEGNSFWDNMKRLAMAGFAMKATERNPNFVSDARSRLKKDQRIILICAVGGTLDTNVKYRRDKKLFADPERQFGRESRSLKAAYELLEAKWNPKNMLHLEDGLAQWRFEGFPLNEEEEE